MDMDLKETDLMIVTGFGSDIFTVFFKAGFEIGLGHEISNNFHFYCDF